MLYPLTFEPIYKDYIWGGVRFGQAFSRQLPFAHNAESWDLSCRSTEMSVVSQGPCKGQKLGDLIESDKIAYLGTRLADIKNFPLLQKLIDANDNLSVQVHPTDSYAQEKDNCPYGKTEMWYILEAPENGSLIAGLAPGVTKEDFVKAIEDNKVEECLGRVPVKKGDVVYIPCGLVHAITKGIMLLEIQQNSDLTYRVYDYNRLGNDGKPRPLHIEKALDVIDFGQTDVTTVTGLKVEENGAVVTYYLANKYFGIQKLDVESVYKAASNPERFFIFTCVEGNGIIKTKDYETRLVPGLTLYIPAAMGEFEIEGKVSLVKSFVPDVERDFIKPLLDNGYNLSSVHKLGSFQF